MARRITIDIKDDDGVVTTYKSDKLKGRHGLQYFKILANYQHIFDKIEKDKENVTTNDVLQVINILKIIIEEFYTESELTYDYILDNIEISQEISLFENQITQIAEIYNSTQTKKN